MNSWDEYISKLKIQSFKTKQNKITIMSLFEMWRRGAPETSKFPPSGHNLVPLFLSSFLYGSLFMVVGLT